MAFSSPSHFLREKALGTRLHLFSFSRKSRLIMNNFLFLLGAAVLSITLLLVILPSFVLTMLWCRRSYFKISSIPKPQHEPRKPSKLESCRSGNENEDGYEFVCLVIVRMRNCPWHVSLAVNWRTRFTKVSFVNQKALKSLLRQVCHPYTASLRSQHDFFPQTRKKPGYRTRSWLHLT